MNVFDPVGTVYRIGRDEFLVWLDSDDDAATAQKLSILRNSIESLSLEAGHPQAAMGFASCGADEKFSPDELFRLAGKKHLLHDLPEFHFICLQCNMKMI